MKNESRTRTKYMQIKNASQVYHRKVLEPHFDRMHRCSNVKNESRTLPRYIQIEKESRTLDT